MKDANPDAPAAAPDARSETPSKLPVIAPVVPAIRLAGLCVVVGGRTLLEDTTLEVLPGECVLLVGPSGAGKSVLLRLLSGLIEPDDRDHEVRGTVQIGASEGPQRTRTGLVFQDHALLDELTAGENLLFARDHSRSPGANAAAERALTFLRDHAIDPGSRVRSLSGGQKQRVAIARAVAHDPDVLLYDEPTSALDPKTANAVADLIREANVTFGKTTIIVTHDYAPFRGKASRVVFFDPVTRKLREVSFEEIAIAMANSSVDPVPPAKGGVSLSEVARATVAGAGAAIWTFFEETPAAVLRILKKVPYAFFPFGARARWFRKSFVHHARICFLGSGIPYMLIAGIIAGFVATYFTYKFLPKKRWSEALVLDDVLPSLGFALYRVVVPVLSTILIAGRTGAALASDIGNRVYLHQTTAMRTLGAKVEPYIATAALWANVIGTIVLAYIAFWAATSTSLGVFAWSQPGHTPYYWSTHFFTKLQLSHAGFAAKGAAWVLAKLIVSGAGTALISYEIGMRPKRSAADVSRGITLTVYWATLFVLVVHLAFAFYEFDNLDELLIGR